MKQINKDQIINKIRECIDLSRKDFDFESTKIELSLIEIYKELIKKDKKENKNIKLINYKIYDPELKKIYDVLQKDSEDGLNKALKFVADCILKETNPLIEENSSQWKALWLDIMYDLEYVPDYIEQVKKELKEYLNTEENIKQPKWKFDDISKIQVYLSDLNKKDLSNDLLVNIFKTYKEIIY